VPSAHLSAQAMPQGSDWGATIQRTHSASRLESGAELLSAGLLECACRIAVAGRCTSRQEGRWIGGTTLLTPTHAAPTQLATGCGAARCQLPGLSRHRTQSSQDGHDPMSVHSCKAGPGKRAHAVERLRREETRASDVPEAEATLISASDLREEGHEAESSYPPLLHRALLPSYILDNPPILFANSPNPHLSLVPSSILLFALSFQSSDRINFASHDQQVTKKQTITVNLRSITLAVLSPTLNSSRSSSDLSVCMR
jgi:hypothetical protein